MDEYKSGKEWNALSDIWKSMSSDQRKENFENFKILSDFIKLNCAIEHAISHKDDEKSLEENYGYLNKLSAEAKQLVIDLVKKGEKNLYHSIMAIIDAKRGEFSSVEQLWEYYSNRFGKTRSYIYVYESEIKEIISLCLIRMDKKGINPL